MSFIVKKENGQLIFSDITRGYETRHPSTKWCITQADYIYKWKDFKQITITTNDAERNDDEYTYSKQNGAYNNLIPDFNFHAWPEVGIRDYSETIELIHLAGLQKPIINKVGWIGGFTNIIRKNLFEIGNQNKELFEIYSMEWKQTGNIQLSGTKYISTPDLVKNYSILIDVEGNGFSARVKHLLWSHRPLLLVDRPHKEYYYEYLIEWEHYIPVKRDLSDLIEKTKWCIDNYDKAKIIAENAYQFSKVYLTREACYKQWDKIINK
jgi:hypothetical protein